MLPRGVLTFDARGVSAAADTPLCRRLAEAWRALLEDRTQGLDEEGRAIWAEASAVKATEQVIEATAFRALLAEACADGEAALALARRASLMGRTEGIPDAEILANLVLARARRHGGQPHLAVRILTALARVAPPPFVPWLSWELLLAGGTRVVAKAGLETQGAAGAMESLLDAAARGDAAAVAVAVGGVRDALAGWPLLRREADAAIALMDPSVPADAAVTAWRAGTIHAVPRGLHGVALPPTAAVDDAVLAYVRGVPGEPGVRLLRATLALVPEGEAAVRANAARRGGGRTETGLAVLALAGPAGLDAAAFFRAVYGFGFSAAAHTGVLDVLLHRMRRRVAGGGEVTKSGDQLTLQLAQPAIFPDPRCALPVSGRVLDVLAARGTVDAMDAARTLGIPLRTVQGALKQLVADGACRMQRVGKLVEYRLEDTTFSEPTSAIRPPRS